jgi:hypothetical protein
LSNGLKPEENNLIREMTNNIIIPRNILTTLKKKSHLSTTTINQIYNARHRFRPSIRDQRLEMEQLMKCLVENIVDTETIRDIF